MSSTTQPTPFYLRRLMSLLGIVPIGAFVVEHALTNALAFFYGFDKWDEAVEWLNGLHYLIVLEIGLIGVPILLHALIGLYIWVLGEPNVTHYGYTRNWLYALQRWSGVIALVFILYHVYKLRIEWKFTTDLDIVTSAYVNAYFQKMWIIAFYFIGITAVSYHFGNGLWNFLIKWGFAVGDRAQQFWMIVCSLAGLGVFAMFLSSLYAFSQPVTG